MFDLETYESLFEEKIGGAKDDYIKMKDIEQNSSGKKYAFVYFNDGMFKLRTFERTVRTEEEIEQNEFDINKFLDINNHTMVYPGFPDPSICCTFISDDLIFVNLYHNPTDMHYHFVYDGLNQTCIKKNVVPMLLNSNRKNFPYKCFYSDVSKEVFSFYR